MLTTASRYADYSSACPRCQQIINTIDITFQQGIFIYDLTFIQQELESVLVAAFERQKQLVEEDEHELKLPLSSMIRLPNGKKPRDFKAERERRRKALSGHVSRKRRMKKSTTKHLLQTIKRERNQNNFNLNKNHSLSTKLNGNPSPSSSSSRPVRSYRPINFQYPYYYDTTTQRNGNNHLSNNKLQINHLTYPDQFWTKILNHQHEYLNKTDWNYLEKLINVDKLLLDNIDYEKEYKEFIQSNDYLLADKNYVHPEFDYSIVLKQNSHFYQLVENILNNNQHKNGSISNNHRLKRKYSSMSNNENSIQIDESILKFFRRDNNTFSSKYAELEHRLTESLNLERLALERAENQYKLDRIQIELNEIDDKILEITNAIRQRKRPSETILSLCKPTSPIDPNNPNLNNENEAWRKGRRQSTLRIYDELSRLIDERINLEKQMADVNLSMPL